MYAALLLLALYAARFYRVSAASEYSQDGVLTVLLKMAPEVKERKVTEVWANGIGCDYWRLRHCIGIELANATNAAKILPERFNDVVNNFCAIVENQYPRGLYDSEARPRLREFSIALNHAYSGYFDCKDSRKPIGEVRLYISDEAQTTNDPKKARLIAKISGR